MKTEAQLSTMSAEELTEFCDEIRTEQRLLIVELRDSRTQFPPAPSLEWAEGAENPSASSIVAVQAHVAQLRDIKATGSVKASTATPGQPKAAPAKEGDAKPKTTTQRCREEHGYRQRTTGIIFKGVSARCAEMNDVKYVPPAPPVYTGATVKAIAGRKT
jgi:hypothetical protein